MPGLQIARLNACQRGGRHLIAVGMVTIQCAHQRFVGHGGWAGIGFTQRGRPALALIAPDIGGPAGLPHLARGQIGRTCQQLGLGERAQAVAEAVAARLRTKAGPQVGPGLAQGVFIQCRGAFAGLHPLGTHQSRRLGQTDVLRAIAAAPRIKSHVHIHHGDARAVYQPDLGTAGCLPVLNRQHGPGRRGDPLRTKNGPKPRQASARSSFFNSIHIHPFARKAQCIRADVPAAAVGTGRAPAARGWGSSVATVSWSSPK